MIGGCDTAVSGRRSKMMRKDRPTAASGHGNEPKLYVVETIEDTDRRIENRSHFEHVFGTYSKGARFYS